MPLSYKILKNTNIEENDNKYVVPLKDIDLSDEQKQNIDEANKILSDAKIEAVNIIESAEKEKLKIIEETKKTAEQEASEYVEELKDKGYEEGFRIGHEESNRKGYEEGLEEGKKQAELLRAQAQQVLENANKKAQEYIDNFENDIVDLAINIARKIANITLNEDKENILKIAKNACVEFRNKEQIIIFIHPVNVDFFEVNIDELKTICPNSIFEIIGDEKIETTGCIIESKDQVIDVQIGSQLEKVKEALLGMRKTDDQQ